MAWTVQTTDVSESVINATATWTDIGVNFSWNETIKTAPESFDSFTANSIAARDEYLAKVAKESTFATDIEALLNKA